MNIVGKKKKKRTKIIKKVSEKKGIYPMCQNLKPLIINYHDNDTFNFFFGLFFTLIRFISFVESI